jgi:hypothetical protein
MVNFNFLFEIIRTTTIMKIREVGTKLLLLVVGF